MNKAARQKRSQPTRPAKPKRTEAAGPAKPKRPEAAKAGRLRIAHIAPVATMVPPPKSGSVETMASLLTEGLVARGHDVTLFATADSKTRAKLSAIYPVGYWHDTDMWPWELYEMLNLAEAVERARTFDNIQYEAA